MTRDEDIKKEIKEVVEDFREKFKVTATERELTLTTNAFALGIVQGIEIATKRGIKRMEIKEENSKD